uniref:Uncharacterized protein n=1 Tax=Panagrolaimus davidi TaxID=227884 RepID=A0A914PVB0_9BILA
MTTNPELDFRIQNVHCETSLDIIDDFARRKYVGKPNDLKTPIIRMFGICENGEKCLANIYGFLPFFYLRSRTPFSDDLKKLVGSLVVKCAKQLDVPLVQGYPLLANVIPFEFKDMYGFYPEKDFFIKVVFYDQILCHRIGLTLLKECGKNELLQPYYGIYIYTLCLK